MKTLALIGVLGTALFLPADQRVLAQRNEARFRFETHYDEPAIVMRFDQSEKYARWWAEIAACEGLPLPPQSRDVVFFAINVREYHPIGADGWSIGSSLVETGQIYLAFPYIGNESIVKHEMLHHLMHWANDKPDPDIYVDPDHPAYRYGTRAAGKCGVYPYRRDSVDYR